ncbi:MAG TPA: NAD(P)/FAD-dependent oxidoreductase [Acidimicrobiia bacterium]|nr:NAD(P)/FAD-dependent oxidoreductase [Acidimicrobiia bacterium]
MADDLRFAIIGAGMAGILSAIQLREAGFGDLTVYEKGDRVGGTWRENTYPGLACDVPSHLYSYSFALNPDWSHTFAPGAEIEEYFEQVAREFDVIPSIRFGEEVTSCTFTDGRWHLETSTGRRDVADFVIAATGVLHHPNMPEIEGLDSFAGPTFHSSRWDHDVSLDGARVGVIGTGSTAVQITTAVVDQVAHYSLFQRTAQWIMPQENPPYPEEVKKQFREHPDELRELHDGISQLFAEGFANAVVDAESPHMKMIEDACLMNLEDNVRDPELRELLRPDYRAACKRLVVSPDFYEAIQHPHAELVTSGIERIEPGGVRTTDGQLHELDVLVLATGFKVDAFMRPMDIIGRNGVKLADVWAERPGAYLSISIPDFPNLFMLNGPNGPVGNFSLIEVAELQFAYILRLIECVRSGACREISAAQAAMQAFEAERVEAAKKTVWVTGCKSWYLDDRGIPATWPWTFDRFREEMAEPKLDAYDRVG